MTHLFRQLLLYVTFEVLEPLWAAFQAKVETAADLDEVGGGHGRRPPWQGEGPPSGRCRLGLGTDAQHAGLLPPFWLSS